MLGPAEVYINPKLSNPSKNKETMQEGCLSVPQIHEEVERPISIDIEALDLNGNQIKTTVTGFKARELMHENDHLNGVLFIDRLSPRLRKLITPYLDNIKKKYNP